MTAKFAREDTAEAGAEVKDMQPRSAAEISRAELDARRSGAVVVEIYDQIYQLRGVEQDHIERLASLVDSKMRAVSAHGATADSLRVAVLAALNLADELLALRASYETLSATLKTPTPISVNSRAGSLMGMLDDVLAERKAS
jgi:cell division protein ZapA